MKIAIGSDHGGFHLKAEMVKWLREKQIEVIDLGAQNLDSIDYPDVAQAVAEEVLLERADKGILICGTGIGISIAANKIDGIRAALCHDVYSAQKSREHNDANILAMGERVIGFGHALLIVEEWLKAKFEGGRHSRRVEKIAGLEK
ncbi:MAG: ribose 5-phosphate isomerase B [Negativicutes bacterium]|nr:ribose 5-phosphate isomerase B [Negativicutes bacterium]